jgi:hypothetical protein
MKNRPTLFTFIKTRPAGNTYWITLCIDLAQPISIQPADDELEEGVSIAAGFFQSFGVTAETPEAALDLAFQEATRGNTAGILSRSETRVDPVELSTLDADIRKLSGNWKKPGIWYRSGRAFFPAEGEAS